MRGARALIWAVPLILAVSLVGVGSAAARPKCGGKAARFVGTKGDDVFRLHKRGRQAVVSRGGDDLIISYAGHDRICAGKGDDVIVAGAQPDLVRAGGGADVVYGGTGPDDLRGGSGRDRIYGDSGSDRIFGGRGADRIFGGIVDDRLHGGPGADLVVGGHGGDILVGEGGADWLRGGSNRDGLFGGRGSDTVSYATATPTDSPTGRGGVTVDLHRGLASGEGSREFVRGIENAVGSPFRDVLIGDGGPNRLEGSFGDDELRGAAGRDTSVGGQGSDKCTSFEAPDSSCNDTDPRGPEAFVALDGHRIDRGLVVVGRLGDVSDRVRLDAGRSGVLVRAATPLAAGPGCGGSGGSIVCAIDPRNLDYVSMAGLDGDDSLAAAGRLPRRGEVQLDGGPGNDGLTGTPSDDILLAGISGKDVLLGGRGNDALFSSAGRDELRGGGGNDQLVTDQPCDGHIFDGGRGKGDIAGFARAVHARLHARLGGKAVDVRKAHCKGTRVHRDNEVLEGTRNADVLIGTPGNDPFLIGGPGADRIEGRGGDDVLNGEEGRDALFGGHGRDLLEAKDGRRDRRIDCGLGSDYVKRDHFDPVPTRCKPPKADPGQIKKKR